MLDKYTIMFSRRSTKRPSFMSSASSEMSSVEESSIETLPAPQQLKQAKEE